MSLTIPQNFMDRIKRELESLPKVIGKVSLHLTFNCGTGQEIGSMKIFKSVEEEMRP